MPTLDVKAHLSTEDLLKAVQQLDLPDLERFVSQVVALRADRVAPCLSQSEADLLQKINRGLPQPLQERYEALAAKRDEETLTPDEQAELIRLSDQMEELAANRVGHLVELARLRKKTLDELLIDLGLQAPAHD
ncbi:MAG TPA: hypothetical protein VEL76_20205 [Gemmataceae bacterium]|nr:hypothetical protein [Gemmataceae bacterium]